MATEWSLPEVANPCPVARRERRPVRALHTGDFAEQRPVVLVDDHHAVLPADEQAMVRRVGDDVVPAPSPPSVYVWVMRYPDGDCPRS